MNTLPYELSHVGTPPIKCQGIKSKLISFLFSSIRWDSKDKGRWIEPFIGSGVVALNLAPQRALLADTNKHIIGFYQAIQRGEMNRDSAREFLECEGKKLALGEAEYYYEVRRRFNEKHSPFDFLFLNRSCFNGVMRFNRHGGFNVPFGHKPQRFAPAYVTKIVNQIGWAAKQMQSKEWEFRVAPWEETLAGSGPEDFVYLDPALHRSSRGLLQLVGFRRSRTIGGGGQDFARRLCALYVAGEPLPEKRPYRTIMGGGRTARVQPLLPCRRKRSATQ